jgi:hypothetical protein
MIDFIFHITIMGAIGWLLAGQHILERKVKHLEEKRSTQL